QTRTKWFQPVPFDPPFNEVTGATGGSLLASWSHTARTGSETTVRGYFDQSRRNDTGDIELMKTVDLDVQNRFAVGSRHDIVWGAGFRSAFSGIRNEGSAEIPLPFRTERLYSFFLQDEIAV